jgi:NADH-quinone oxidoreductase subunit C
VSELRGLIEAACPSSTLEEIEHAGELTIEVDPDRIVDVCAFLKDAPGGFAMLSDVTCADFVDGGGGSPTGYRFRLAYHLFSVETGERVRLRVWVSSVDPEVDSVTGVWATANWQEREVWDMFGVRFRGHPDLSRILMPFDWEGHPLRRDYPLGGEEVEFSDAV